MVFRYLYWGIYVFVVGCMLVLASNAPFNAALLAGWVAVLLAIFLVIYGFVISLHHKLMKRHG